jgi:hypothetical protein
VKPHPRKLPDPPTAPQPKNPHNRTLLNIPRGERGEQSAPLGRANTSARHTGEITPTATGSSGKACVIGTPLARLTRRKEAGRTATPTSGRAGGGTHGVRTYTLPPSGDNVCGFAIRRNEGVRHPARPQRNIFKGIL